MKYRIIIQQDEDGMFVAECSSLPGCVSQGKTRKEARDNIKDAIIGYLASLKKHDEPIPPSIEDAMAKLVNFKGSSKKKVSDKEYEANRDKAFKEISRKIS